MYIYTIVDIRNQRGYTGKSETDPSDILNPRFYMKTNNLSIYATIRNQGIDWFKLTVMKGDNKLYRKILKKYNHYNYTEEQKQKRKEINIKISITLKEHWKNNVHPILGTKHSNVTWRGNKRTYLGYGWIITHLDQYGAEVTDAVDNLRDWVISHGYEISKIKWRVQGYRNETKKPAFPYGRIINIKRISGPKHVINAPHIERKRTKWDKYNYGEQEMVE